MCCFSRPVKLVADTNIFARASKDGRQYLVYSMRLDAAEDLAMILPIPVPSGSPENAVKFINLEKYPHFFADMRRGFPMPPAAGGVGRAKTKSAAPYSKLDVVTVGSFEASFVPRVADFERLDERFRLPAGVWDQLPMYRDFGFAVFKLKKGNQNVHPMAFEFPRAKATEIFFPTVHIHDGSVHPRARFHHDLYCQRSGGENLMSWNESPGIASSFVKKIELTQGIVDPDGHCYRRVMRGTFLNEDVKVTLEAA
jgi:hypothetical protein